MLISEANMKIVNLGRDQKQLAVSDAYEFKL